MAVTTDPSTAPNYSSIIIISNDDWSVFPQIPQSQVPICVHGLNVPYAHECVQHYLVITKQLRDEGFTSLDTDRPLALMLRHPGSRLPVGGGGFTNITMSPK